MRGILSSLSTDAKALVEKARNIPSMAGLDLATVVSTPERYEWTASVDACSPSERLHPAGETKYHVVAYDFGIKHNILRMLAAEGCQLLSPMAQVGSKWVASVGNPRLTVQAKPPEQKPAPDQYCSQEKSEKQKR